MASTNYDRSLARVLVFEGGKVDDPQDPGGRTNQGVTERVYHGWRARRGLPKRDVYLMEAAERDAIYREGYWTQVRGDDLPAGVDLVVFDGAVNSGPGQSIKWLQRALGVTKIDGVIGPVTLTAVAAHPDHDKLVAAIIERRFAFLRTLKTWKRYGRGWTSRLNQVRTMGQAMATGSVVPQAKSVEGGNAKAPIEKAKPLPNIAPADAATGAGMATGGAGAALQQAKEALLPLAGNGGWIDTTIAVLTVGGVAMVIGGMGWRWYASRKAHDQADALDLPAGVTA